MGRTAAGVLAAAVALSAAIAAGQTDAKRLRPADLEPSLVTIEEERSDVGDVLRKIAEQTGNQPVRIEPAAAGARVTLTARGMTYWEAMDEICRQAGLAFEGAPSPGLIRRGGYPDLGARSGPVAVKLVTGESSRVFLKAPGHAGGKRITLGLRVFWEDRLPVTSGTFLLTEVVADDGTALPLPAKPAPIRPQTLHSSTRPNVRLMAYDTMYPAFENVPVKARRIARMKGTVTLEIAAGLRIATVADVFADDRRPVVSDGFSLEVLAIGALGADLCVAYRLTEKDKPVAPEHFAPGSLFGLRLEGDGAEQHGTEWNPRAISADKLPEKVRPFADGKDPAARIAIFRRIDEGRGPWALAYAVPTERLSREYPFVLENLPMP